MVSILGSPSMNYGYFIRFLPSQL
ncbi:unnamed protein product, partial [Rotaria sp. Silwood2]